MLEDRVLLKHTLQSDRVERVDEGREADEDLPRVGVVRGLLVPHLGHESHVDKVPPQVLEGGARRTVVDDDCRREGEERGVSGGG